MTNFYHAYDKKVLMYGGAYNSCCFIGYGISFFFPNGIKFPEKPKILGNNNHKEVVAKNRSYKKVWKMILIIYGRYLSRAVNNICLFIKSLSSPLTKRPYNHPLDSDYGQLTIPHINQTRYANFEQFRQHIGNELFMVAFMNGKVTEWMEGMQRNGQFFFPNYFELINDAKNVQKSPEVIEILSKNKGFCLMEHPFYIPSIPEKLLDRLWNNFYIFKLKEIDPTFDLTRFYFTLPEIFEIISQKLYKKDFSSLKGLIGDEALDGISENISKLDDKDLQILNLTTNDLYKFNKEKEMFSTEFKFFAIDITKVLFTESHVKLFVCYKAFYKYAINGNYPSVPKEYGYETPKIVFGNLVFSKMIKPEVDVDWTISELNYIVVP